jgi:thiol-disulfide isomerase/thioredoxin
MNKSTFSKIYLYILAFSIVAVISVSWLQYPGQLKNGLWRATITRTDGHEIVFNFLSKDSAGKKVIYIINGEEHLLVDSVMTRADSVFIQLPFFESGFRARITEQGNLEGQWIKHYGERILRLPFKAEFNQAKRFDVSSAPVANISGSWVSTFVNKGKKSTYVAEFKQQGSRVTGTVLDPTGDFRFLQGVVSGDSLKLSTFDGANAYLLIAKIDDRNHISAGKFYAGATGTEDWTAVRKEDANPGNGFEEPKIDRHAGKVNFTFPDSKTGKPVSFSDKKYKGKVVVLDILGSWCPNCMDETKFLSDYYINNRNKGFEIIGLAYERTTDFKSSQEALMPFEKRLNVQYPILITGVTSADTLKTQKTLPQLEKIKAFPTIIFVDKKGNMRKVESGFSGPATGRHYTEFKKNFDKTVKKLLAE